MYNTRTMKKMTKEELEATYFSPKVYYGFTFSYRWALEEDPHGELARDGKRYSRTKVVTNVNACECKDKEAALLKLKEEYNWWCNLHPNHTFLPFEECIRRCEPECSRENPYMHGLYICMIPA